MIIIIKKKIFSLQSAERSGERLKPYFLHLLRYVYKIFTTRNLPIFDANSCDVSVKRTGEWVHQPFFQCVWCILGMSEVTPDIGFGRRNRRPSYCLLRHSTADPLLVWTVSSCGCCWTLFCCVLCCRVLCAVLLCAVIVQYIVFMCSLFLY